MYYKASHRYADMTARKMRPFAAMVRGMNIDEALEARRVEEFQMNVRGPRCAHEREVRACSTLLSMKSGGLGALRGSRHPPSCSPTATARGAYVAAGALRGSPDPDELPDS